jgi:uncharacterized peroxidase-related enzyme
MDDQKISRFGAVELDELPADLSQRIEAIAEKTGFVPNVFLALGHRPDELRAFMDYHDALLNRDDGLSKSERELVVVATSGANNCTYCVVAHGAILRLRSKDPHISDRVAINPWSCELNPRQRAIADIALKLCHDSDKFGDADLAVARSAGLTDAEVWDVGAITALFALSNRLAHLMDLRPNEEFFLMGRSPDKVSLS